MALDIHRSGNTTYESVHNYIDDSGMIRKGATSAELSKTIILPFNRTEGIWIMRGLGNPDWNYSAPHGAGRVMSRGEAKRKLNQAEQDELMEKSGVYSSANPLDESPAVYKTPEEVRRYLGETAEFMFAIKPILNIKDGN
jgi:RNA-splicing ligase RtcB